MSQRVNALRCKSKLFGSGRRKFMVSVLLGKKKTLDSHGTLEFLGKPMKKFDDNPRCSPFQAINGKIYRL